MEKRNQKNAKLKIGKTPQHTSPPTWCQVERRYQSSVSLSARCADCETWVEIDAFNTTTKLCRECEAAVDEHKYEFANGYDDTTQYYGELNLDHGTHRDPEQRQPWD